MGKAGYSIVTLPIRRKFVTGLVWDHFGWFDRLSGAEPFFAARKRNKEQELEW
jgi:hypothetical protein